mmetsp:Transcript_96000/g.228621  ORF Transcript_96000/g.228621 Transcript_96000/m.228621 type:complete len:325 (-) Transcript_96000:365-1339(-)
MGLAAQLDAGGQELADLALELVVGGQGSALAAGQRHVGHRIRVAVPQVRLDAGALVGVAAAKDHHGVTDQVQGDGALEMPRDPVVPGQGGALQSIAHELSVCQLALREGGALSLGGGRTAPRLPLFGDPIAGRRQGGAGRSFLGKTPGAPPEGQVPLPQRRTQLLSDLPKAMAGAETQLQRHLRGKDLDLYLHHLFGHEEQVAGAPASALPVQAQHAQPAQARGGGQRHPVPQQLLQVFEALAGAPLLLPNAAVHREDQCALLQSLRHLRRLGDQALLNICHGVAAADRQEVWNAEICLKHGDGELQGLADVSRKHHSVCDRRM